MTGCRRDCLHRQMVEDYRAARERDEQTRDRETIGYPTENASYYRDNPEKLVTFRSWLEQLAGRQVYTRTPPEPDHG